MEWLAENWLWVVVLILFIAMHMFSYPFTISFTANGYSKKCKFQRGRRTAAT